MKKEATAFATTADLPQEITAENKHLFPPAFQETFEFLKKNKGKILFPEKYFKGQKELVIEKAKSLFRENPGMPLRQVIRKVLKGMPDFLTGENLVQVVTYITETWAKCQAEAGKEASAPAMVGKFAKNESSPFVVL